MATRLRERTVFFIIAVILSDFEIGMSSETRCPSKCKCAHQTVHCNDIGLHYIPSVPNDTRLLEFTGNNLPYINKTTFYNISKLNIKEMTLSDNKINFISNDSFELFPMIRTLILNDNFVHVSFLHDAFYGLRNSNIDHLELNAMVITHLEDDTFEYLENTPIRSIDLNKNFLTFLNGTVFRKLRNFSSLSLKNNNIKAMDLSGMGNLKELSLLFNNLQSIPVFCNEACSVNHEGNKSCSGLLPKLEMINMASNEILQIKGDMFVGKCLPKLRKLTLDTNPFKTIPNNTFSDLPSLRSLSVTHLKSKGILFGSFAFNSSTLESLYLNNHISNFKFSYRNIFRKCPNLNLLNMLSIRLTDSNGTMLKVMLSPLTRLKTLILQNTDTFYLPVGLFNTMPNLTTLNLKYNKISTWHDDTFLNATSLRTIYFDHNRINLVNKTSFPPEVLHNLKLLDLRLNPFSCTCDAFWFRHWIEENTKKLYQLSKFICALPASMFGKRLMSLNPTYRQCLPISPYIILAASIGSAAVLLVTIAVVLFRYRWHIKHYIYLMRARKGYQRIPEGDNYFYDIFVAYNSADRVWVISQLIPVLEKKEGMKLCLHDRVFEADRLIVDNIQDNINRSRKTLLILSNKFASQWCMFEMTLAQARNIKEDRNQVIVVMLEDIRAKYTPSSLHVLLKSTTYIPWTLDAKGNDSFWKKLIDAIRN